MKWFSRKTAIMAVIVAIALGSVTLGALARGDFGSSGKDQGNTVTVTLTDMNIASSRTTFQAGVTYHFVVANDGQVNHELMIMMPMASGKMSMEEMDKMSIADIEEDDLPPGATKTVDVTFEKAYPAGSLELACHLPGHYDAGMHLPITVNPAS